MHPCGSLDANASKSLSTKESKLTMDALQLRATCSPMDHFTAAINHADGG
jgi:hypothetical protein